LFVEDNFHHRGTETRRKNKTGDLAYAPTSACICIMLVFSTPLVAIEFLEFRRDPSVPLGIKKTIKRPTFAAGLIGN